MRKDWNYAHMWDTMRRAMEDSAIKGLEVRPLDVLSDMNTLEELEEQLDGDGEGDDGGMASNIAAEKTAMEAASRTREMETMFDVKIVPYNTQAEEAEECE